MKGQLFRGAVTLNTDTRVLNLLPPPPTVSSLVPPIVKHLFESTVSKFKNRETPNTRFFLSPLTLLKTKKMSSRAVHLFTWNNSNNEINKKINSLGKQVTRDQIKILVKGSV